MVTSHGSGIRIVPVLLLFVACASAPSSQRDLVRDIFPEAQIELRTAVDAIAGDAMAGNIEADEKTVSPSHFSHVSFVRDGELSRVNGRQTLVFLRTEDGWKIVHEHGTIRS